VLVVITFTPEVSPSILDTQCIIQYSPIYTSVSHGTPAYSSIPHGTVTCSSIPHGTVTCISIPHGTVTCSSILHGTETCSSILHGTVTCSSILHGTLNYPLLQSCPVSLRMHAYRTVYTSVYIYMNYGEIILCGLLRLSHKPT
jgi:hypothetical protein